MRSEFSQVDIDEEKKEKALEDGLKRLNLRMRTEKELRLWLAQKGHPSEIIDTAIGEIKEQGYLDDEEYCRQYFFYAKKKGKADYRILKELEEKGIPSSKGKEIFAELRCHGKEDILPYGENVETDDMEIARDIGKKMMEEHLNAGKEKDDKFMAKVSRRLVTLGYPSSTIYRAIETLWKEREE